jgi:hypothetical protein
VEIHVSFRVLRRNNIATYDYSKSSKYSKDLNMSAGSASVFAG